MNPNGLKHAANISSDAAVTVEYGKAMLFIFILCAFDIACFLLFFIFSYSQSYSYTYSYSLLILILKTYSYREKKYIDDINIFFYLSTRIKSPLNGAPTE